MPENGHGARLEGSRRAPLALLRNTPKLFLPPRRRRDPPYGVCLTVRMGWEGKSSELRGVRSADAMTETNPMNRIMIYGPKEDGTYVVEFILSQARPWRSPC
jgi:hypothetical protein